MKTNILGVGVPPIGWPGDIAWEGVSGTTRSRLSFDDITRIICSILTAAGLNPDTHVVPGDVVNAVLVQGDEQINIDEIIEDHIVQVNTDINVSEVEIESDNTVDDTMVYRMEDVNCNERRVLERYVGI